MDETEWKIQELKQFGLKRQQNCYNGHFPIRFFHNGKYESEFVSLYTTKSAANTNSPIVVLLQDWSSYDKLNGPFNKDAAELGHTRSLPTNRNLKILLSETFSLQLSNVFAANVFPFIKTGGISFKIPQADIFRAYKEFCYPQIEIVKPKLVICCGKEAYVATLNYFRKPTNNLEPVCNHFRENGILFYHQFHTGSHATGFNGVLETIRANWLRMKRDYEKFVESQTARENYYLTSTTGKT